MRREAHAFFLLFIAATVLACVGETDSTRTESDLASEAFVTANGIRLSYLDWGGEGPALLMIHGLGDSPHVFHHLASDLRHDFRVIAYARRGHGHSDSPDGPYDNATLVEDLRVVMDSLGIARAHLLGWSMGGNEITEFAGRYADRVGKLVYLEAGYDWSDAALWEAWDVLPISLEPDSASLESLYAYRSWFHGFLLPGVPWTPELESHLGALTRIGSDGRVQVIPRPDAMEKLMVSLATSGRDYAAIRAPALALYSTSFFSTESHDSASAQALLKWERDMIDPFRQASIARIREELSDVVVQEIENTTHVSIGFHNQELLVTTIRDFLMELR